MRKFCCFLLALALVLGLSLSVTAAPAKDQITTPATGYDSADDVEYVTYSGTIKVTGSTSYTVKDVVVNWGARDEECTFLSTYAESYYTGSYGWDALSALSGGTGTSDAYNSQLYEALQDMMQSMHTKQTNYNETRAYYAFTDCVANDYSKISCFYTGTVLSGAWDSGKTWNREHTWPNSKGLGGNDENDIMMLRPTSSSENSSRGNKAYGESSGFYDPGVSVRGDCARIFLYIYVRWGNVNGNSDYKTVWGSSGVIENLDILLKWMEEDPVDTWEMGRNDAVESITGVRNVFVDYPEYAWLLFGEEIPEDMVTPSGEAMEEDAPACTHTNTEVRNKKNATCGEAGYSGDTYCRDCGELLSGGSVIPATGNHVLGSDGHCTGCEYYEEPAQCTHENEEHRNQADATCGADGYSGDTYCKDCGAFVAAGSVISATGEHTLGEDGNCTGCDYYEEAPECLHENVEHRNQKEATCIESGHTGDTYCTDCGELVAGGSVIPATGEHSYDESGSCTVCGHTESQPDSKPSEPKPSEPNPSEPGSQGSDSQEPAQNTIWIWIAVGGVVVLIAAIVIIRAAKKKK